VSSLFSKVIKPEKSHKKAVEPKRRLGDPIWGIRMQYRNNALDNILKEESWIVEGVYYRWVAQAFKDADLIIILTTSKWIRHLRISRRFIKRKLGIMSSKKEKLRDFKDLVKWNHKFDSDNLIRIRKFISDHENKIVECKEIQDVLKIIYNT
jgi:hypothetical protein